MWMTGKSPAGTSCCSPCRTAPFSVKYTRPTAGFAAVQPIPGAGTSEISGTRVDSTDSGHCTSANYIVTILVLIRTIEVLFSYSY